MPVRATFVTPGIHRSTDVRSPRTCRPGGTRTGALLELAPATASAAGQPIFYPVLNQDYAVEIVRDWNVRRSGAGYVTRFRVRQESGQVLGAPHADEFPVGIAGHGCHSPIIVGPQRAAVESRTSLTA